MCLQILYSFIDNTCSISAGNVSLRIEVTVLIQSNKAKRKCCLDSSRICNIHLILIGYLNRVQLQHRQLAAGLQCINQQIGEGFTAHAVSRSNLDLQIRFRTNRFFNELNRFFSRKNLALSSRCRMCLQIRQRIADLYCRFGTGDFLLRIQLPAGIQRNDAIVQSALDRTGVLYRNLILIGKFHDHWFDHR
ncbi:hypothetical protein D3C73_1098920 [compost metagenome]